MPSPVGRLMLPIAMWRAHKGGGCLSLSALGTIYHKLSMQCYVKGVEPPGGSYSSSCRDAFGEPFSGIGSTSEQSPIFDLTTSTNISLCNGAACRQAASAVLAYQVSASPDLPMYARRHARCRGAPQLC